ncbi:Mini-ribonuclease 3 [Leptolyngbya iicbica LK]|uniref:Mini-ribonuclease 3 n=3 Tax=Cyanophyceae TaxID=3028117 RepID=A0A4Q7E4F0_9CYAN|nr:Mini-ribonuclease 3 [Leptolyngbya sp. LK]
MPLEGLLCPTQGLAQYSEQQLRSLSPLALAYIGDAVFELFVRSRLLWPPQQVRTFHRQVVSHVRAEQQAQYLECLQPYLSAAEKDILRRARNAASGRKVRASLRDYRQATALEALLGYLYLTDAQRLIEILSYLPITPEVIPAEATQP